MSRIEQDEALQNEASALKQTLQDIDLRMTQAILASTIGKKNKTEFLRGELERIRNQVRLALAQ